uniref:Uncharacterized protein n=1 Tax=Rhizophora mucronata TaxID=61149 RepID=A0A2P2QWK2_RHIMU
MSLKKILSGSTAGVNPLFLDHSQRISVLISSIFISDLLDLSNLQERMLN